MPSSSSHRLRRSLALGVLVPVTALVATAFGGPAAAAPPPVSAATASPSRDVIANLFMWPWTSVSTECAKDLGRAGFGAVQVSPPADSISVPGHPWWEVYQPASYTLTSRLGTRDQFAAMVATCHAAGVRVYVDAVVNHMTGSNQSSTTSYGGATFVNGSSYPGAGYTAADFHTYPADCPQPDNQIHDWNDATEVQKCQLVSLSDLRTESDKVRSAIAGYLKGLMDLGVDGFRVDAAKHVPQTDMAAIRAKLPKQPKYFGQEIYPGSTNKDLQPAAFERNGDVLGFDYAFALKKAFTGKVAELNSLGSGSGLRPGEVTTAFVSNHDTERGDSTLSYKNGATDVLATVFMLAWNYGTPNVMSSYTFSGNDDSPPADAKGFVSAVTCGRGWECQHRKVAVANMVGFHNATRTDSTVSNWWSDGADRIAFSRGPAGGARGWVLINNGGSAAGAQVFSTGLPAGTYCDVIHGEFDSQARTCGGSTVVVGADGKATVAVDAKDAVALHVNARAAGGAGRRP
jgi:alpha-amylase